MLEPAYYHRDELNKVMAKAQFEEKYKYYFVGGWLSYTFKLEDNTWDELAFCSIKDNKILGFFRLHFDRNSDKGYGLCVINFAEKNNFTFSKDFMNFLLLAFNKFKIRKIEFNVVVGNPIEKMYDRFVKHYGGRIVGVQYQAVKLLDQEYYDYKLYEITRKTVLAHLPQSSRPAQIVRQ